MSNKKCVYCGHSRAAHADGVKCALCRCRSEEVTMIQDSFAFRSSLPTRGHAPAVNTRKR
jgi:hypothetical protein